LVKVGVNDMRARDYKVTEQSQNTAELFQPRGCSIYTKIISKTKCPEFLF